MRKEKMILQAHEPLAVSYNDSQLNPFSTLPFSFLTVQWRNAVTINNMPCTRRHPEAWAQERVLIFKWQWIVYSHGSVPAIDFLQNITPLRVFKYRPLEFILVERVAMQFVCMPVLEAFQADHICCFWWQDLYLISSLLSRRRRRSQSAPGFFYCNADFALSTVCRILFSSHLIVSLSIYLLSSKSPIRIYLQGTH